MAKKVFNLSIKDLKEILGLFKKKKRRKRNKKTINNTRASSQHMIPSNVSTLQSENLHLINKQLENKIVMDNDKKVDDQLVVANKPDDIAKLQNDINGMRAQGELMFKDVYSKYSNLSNIQSKNMNKSNVVRSNTFDDNIDVSTTGGDDDFQNVRTAQTEPTQTEPTFDNETKDDMATPPKKRSYIRRTPAQLIGDRTKSLRIATQKAAKENALQEEKDLYKKDMESVNALVSPEIMESKDITKVKAERKKIRQIKEKK